MVTRGQVVDQPSKGFNRKDKKRSRNCGLNTPESEEGTWTKRAKTEDSANPVSNTGNGDSLSAHTSSTEPSEGEPEEEAEAETEEGDSDDDDDDTIDPVRDAVTSKDPSVMGKILLPSDRPFRPRRPCKYFLRGKCTRGDQCTFSHDPSLAVRLDGGRGVVCTL